MQKRRKRTTTKIRTPVKNEYFTCQDRLPIQPKTGQPFLTLFGRIHLIWPGRTRQLRRRLHGAEAASAEARGGRREHRPRTSTPKNLNPSKKNPYAGPILHFYHELYRFYMFLLLVFSLLSGFIIPNVLLIFIYLCSLFFSVVSIEIL